MKKFMYIWLGLFLGNYFCADDSLSRPIVYKNILKNGMTVLIVPVQDASQVAVQIWYKIGSKHETFGERGMAHFIEHMTFKGTEQMLSESDVLAISNTLAASMNAGTSYDFTCYYFTLPLANWSKILPIFADWMQHCRFNQDHMDSEVKAVIQELKMINDQHERFLKMQMMSTIFDSHPYHYSVIGYKQDLWNLKRATLLQFYKKHYIAQNATLVLVGNVNPEQALGLVQEQFETIAPGEVVAQPNTYQNQDIVSKKIVFYRDVQQPIGLLSFVVPGLQHKTMQLINVLQALLANGKSSRLHKKLVDQLHMVSGISASNVGTHEYELFNILFYPNKEDDFEYIKEVILAEIAQMARGDLSDVELRRAVKLSQMERCAQLEQVDDLAQQLGWLYLATGDEYEIFQSLDGKEALLKNQIQTFLQQYFRPSLCHEGHICKLCDADKVYSEALQQVVAQQDGQALAQLARESTVEEVKYAQTVVGAPTEKKEFCKPELFSLKNGLEVMLCKTSTVDAVSCCLDMLADESYVADGYEGALDLVCKMMLEGTKKYPGLSFAQEVESYGMQLSVVPGSICCDMLASDIEQGLTFVSSMVQQAEFKKGAFGYLKDKQKILVKAFFDNPRNLCKQTAKELIYKNHPYSKLLLGTEQSLEKIDHKFCYDLYKKFISPSGARLTIVGNIDVQKTKQLVQNLFGSWKARPVAKMQFPELSCPASQQINIEKNRDQIFLAFVGLSVSRLDPAYDALLIFDQILTGSSLHTMDTLLFKLRAQTGLFYTAGGSCLFESDEQPGMVFIATMVAPDRVDEACKIFMQTLTQAVDTISDQTFELAKENIITTFCKLYDTNAGRAQTFNFLRRYNFPFDYFEKRFDCIRSLLKKEMLDAVKKVLSTDKISCIKIGKWLNNSTGEDK